MQKRLLLIVALAAALVAAGYWAYAPQTAPAAQPPLAVLGPENLAEFQKQFNESADRIRVLALLSPT